MPPTDWPDPPLLTYLLFERPWAPVVALACLGLALVVAGGRGERPAVHWTGWGTLACAGALPLLAFLVQTDRERIRDNTYRLAEAVTEPWDRQALIELTTADARLLRWGRQEMLVIAEAAATRVTAGSYRLTELRVRADGEVGQSYVEARGRLDSQYGSFPFRTRWMLHWTREQDGRWRLSAVETVDVDGRSAEPYLARMLQGTL